MKKLFIALLPLLALLNPVHAEETTGVVVSIKPLHSLVQGVMGHTGTAELLVDSAATPHGFSLKPSQVRKLQNAQILFFVDELFETFLENAVSAAPAQLHTIGIIEEATLPLLDLREGGAWDSHTHEEHSDHGDKNQTHDHHEHDGEHDHAGKNLHVWLDTNNARRIIAEVTRQLTALFPENSAVYSENAQKTQARLDVLDAKIAKTLAPVRSIPFIVLHDAYQYFEIQQGLTGVGSITVEPDEPPSINRLREIRQKLKVANAVCLFREPQFDDRLMITVAEGSSVKSGTLDPIGANLPAGADLYFDLLSNLANGLVDCLK